jgi:Stage II sporulation protein E (SpoIIE)
VSDWRTGTILCLCAGLVWPASVAAHDGHGRPFGPPGGATGAPAPALFQRPAPAATQPPAGPLAAGSNRHGFAPHGPSVGGPPGAGNGNGSAVHHGADNGVGVAHAHAVVDSAHGGGHENNFEIGHSPKESLSGNESGAHKGRLDSGSHGSHGSSSGGGSEGESGSSAAAGSSASEVPTVTLPKTEPAGSNSHSSGAAGSAPSSTPASTGSPSGSSAAPAAPASTPATTSNPSVTGSAPESATHGAGRHHRRASGHHHVHAAATLHTLPGAAVRGAVTAAATGTEAHAPATAPTRTGARPAHRSSSSSSAFAPAIRTVERIANVVPRGIWIVMGLLGALTGLLAGGSWLASRRARRLERQRGYLAEEVGLLQAALLPAIPERFGPVIASVAYRPAEGPAAGGDFYDLFALEDGRIAVIVGDISGHGPTALPQTALIRYTLRTYLDAGLVPRAALHAAAITLDHQLEGSFATVVLAIYDPADRTLTYACAGHPPPIVLAPEPVEPIVAGAAPPIGAGMPTGSRQTILQLPLGSEVCFFTDGIVEARLRGELYGAGRLTATLAALGSEATAKDVLDHVVAATDRRPDDMAACVLHLDRAPDLGMHLTAANGAGANGAGADGTHPNGSTPAGVVRSEELEIDRAALGSERVRRFLVACGLSETRVAEALRAAHVVVDSAGEAVLRLRFGGGRAEIEVLPHNTGVLHLAKQPDSSREPQLTGGR